MLSGLLGIGVNENILWQDIPYIIGQHGNIYFQVKENEDIMQTVVSSDNNYVEWVAVLEDGDEDDDYVSDPDESLGDWANLETMWYCHPMYLARRIVEVAPNVPVNWMEQPSAGLAIQGLLSRVVAEDHSDIQKHSFDCLSTYIDRNEGEESEILEVENPGKRHHTTSWR